LDVSGIIKTDGFHAWPKSCLRRVQDRKRHLDGFAFHDHFGGALGASPFVVMSPIFPIESRATSLEFWNRSNHQKKLSHDTIGNVDRLDYAISRCGIGVAKFRRICGFAVCTRGEILALGTL
jgi:hypothetical protein